MRDRLLNLTQRLVKPILLLMLAAVVIWKGIYGLPVESTCLWLTMMCGFTAALLILTALSLLRRLEDGDEPD